MTRAKRRTELLAALCAILAPALVTAMTNDPAPLIDPLFAEFNQPRCPGASVMVVHEGKAVFARGYGLADREAKVACDTNTNFRLASVTKQFTAMSALMLVERKQLGLDESLQDVFPEFPDYGKRVRIRHLLNHTSGLLDYEEVIPAGTTIPVLDRDVLRLMLRLDKTYFEPGSQFRYSNTAYALLALIVEARSGRTFGRFLKENIFEPLGMTGTLAYEQGSSVVPRRAFGYSAHGDVFERTDQSLTSSVLGDGGVYSSVADLYRWDQALYTDKLLSKELLDLAFTPGAQSDKPERGYGFGWYIGRYRGLKEIWHSGNTRGFTTRIARFPEKRFSVIILANRSDAQIAELPHRIADRLLFE